MSIISIISGSGRSIPNAPTIGTATNTGSGRAYNNGAASVTFTAPTYTGRTPITSYTVTSSPGGFTGTGASSPISVTGLQSNTAYTFTVTATNAIGTSAASSASNSITATTIPQTPTITSATRSSNTVVSIAFTGATGGAALSAVTATSSPSVSITSSGTSSPMTATATYVQGTSYTFTITATNANGTSSASSASSSVTPFPAPALGSWTASTNYPINTTGGRWVASPKNQSRVWLGTGIVGGPSSSNLGYFWNGSSWSSQNYPQALFRSGAGSNASDSLSVSMGGYNFGAASYFAQVYTYTTSFSNVTSYPVSTLGQGVAGLYNSYVIGVAGATTSTSYYAEIPGVPGWTANPTWPAGNGEASGVNNLDQTTAYFWKGGTTTMYSGGVGVSWTLGTAAPTAVDATGGRQRINGKATWVYPDTNSVNNYFFDGTTWTAQTSLPMSLTQGQGGSIGDTLSALAGSQNNVQHYTSVLT
jgi:trimeric autotransporter adhesin